MSTIFTWMGIHEKLNTSDTIRGRPYMCLSPHLSASLKKRWQCCSHLFTWQLQKTSLGPVARCVSNSCWYLFVQKFFNLGANKEVTTLCTVQIWPIVDRLFRNIYWFFMDKKKNKKLILFWIGLTFRFSLHIFFNILQIIRVSYWLRG